MSIISARRDNDKKEWACTLAGIELYRGPSANKAQDLVESMTPEIMAGNEARYARIGNDATKKTWATLIGEVVIDDFGSSANKAADLAEKINDALRISMGAPRQGRPNTPVDDLGTVGAASDAHVAAESLPHHQPEDGQQVDLADEAARHHQV